MVNLEMIIHILYKRVPAQEVIEGKLCCDSFDEAEFLRMMSTYVLYYSENEAANLLNYYTYIFRENARITGRETSDDLNVFEALFYCAFRFLCIKNNEILCHYEKLLEWRKAALELGENLFVTAYLAARVPENEVIQRGFMWKRVIGHDNVQLNTMLGRGYSENHFHLNGSAPIFHISWISLMNNLTSSKLVSILESYDRERRYTNTAYKSGYREFPFYVRAMQAALIRLLIYSRLSGKHLKIGEYYVSPGSITGYFDQSLITNPKLMINGDAVILAKDIIQDCYIFQNDKNTVLDIIDLVCCFHSSMSEDGMFLQDETTNVRRILNDEMWKYEVSQEGILEALDIDGDISFCDLFIRLLNKVPRINLENARSFISDMDTFYEIWDQITLKNIVDLLKEPEELIYQITSIQSSIDVYRMGGNTQPGQERSMDYALHEVDEGYTEGGKENFLFAGERWLMYRMFRNIYSYKKMDSKYYNLFYAYLLIKESIRSELVQSNRNVGFENFRRYQSRKGNLLADDVYKNAFVKMAVSENMFTTSMKRLEVRICPAETVEKNRQMILRTDELLDPDNKKREQFFYTLHFIKSPDDIVADKDYCPCRHNAKRKRVKRQAFSIAALREKYPIVGRRILGIDAASNEIGCRPEVFAVAFRYLKDHRWSYVTSAGEKKLPQLYSTYHVGEDFLDLADGLRAIEEAVLFLRLESGDRLGHALALGIDVDEWYESKNYRVVLPRQDYLDNLVWIYHKLSEFNIAGFENLKEWILGEFTILFSNIYASAISKSELECISEQAKNAGCFENYLSIHSESSVFNYYYAWMLRGDSPELYAGGFFNEKEFLRQNSPFLVNPSFPECYELRRYPDISLLYYMYHYNQKVRDSGSRIQEFPVGKYYVKAVSEIQKALQKEIADRGIAIETNPSSNILIGTFRKYEKHPIIHFYNRGLVHSMEQLQECPQIPVSVNTDDQGVFNTSLENEYALLARAMESVTDQYGKPIYNKCDIYDWLDQIRCMGNEQSFGYIDDMKEKGGYYDLS